MCPWLGQKQAGPYYASSTSEDLSCSGWASSLSNANSSSGISRYLPTCRIVKKGFPLRREPRVRSPHAKWRLLICAVPRCCLNIRHLSQPELKWRVWERKGRVPGGREFSPFIFQNEISWEPLIQIMNCFHFWAPRVEIFKTRSHVDRFRQTFFFYIR